MTFIGHEACPECGSKDNLARYEDGGAKCFSASCTYWEAKDNEQRSKKIMPKEFTPFTGEASSIKSRGISLGTCKKWGYLKNTDDGICHVANFYEDGKVVGQKIRKPGKKFLTLGKMGLYGKWLYPNGGKFAVLVEGELDALSIAEVSQGSSYFCPMSVPNGAQSAAKHVKAEAEWLTENFEKVIVFMDKDEPGKKAAEEIIGLFSPDKVCRVYAPEGYKDANDLLKEGKVKELMQILYDGRDKVEHIDGIYTGEALREAAFTEPDMGLTLPWPTISSEMYGFNPGEIWVLIGGTSCGKTEISKELAYHCLKELEGNVGVIFMEDSLGKVIQSFMGKHLNKPITRKDIEVTTGEKEEAFKEVTKDNKLVVYDTKGNWELTRVMDYIRYLVRIYRCKYIFLDHLTAITANASDTNKELHCVMNGLNKVTQETGCFIFATSHINKSGGCAEEGADLNIDSAYGSSAIKQVASTFLGFIRDQRVEMTDETHASILKVLKHRSMGHMVGRQYEMSYDVASGRLNERGVWEDA